MDLYVLRHGDAVDTGAPGVATDAQRYLTEEGVEDMEEAALGIKRLERDFGLILSSPYPRATQTARIVARVLNREGALEETDRMAPGATFEDIVAMLRSRSFQGEVMIVGHNPDLEQIIARSIALDGVAAITLKKGALAIVRFEAGVEAGHGALRALLSNRHLRLMGKA